MGEKWVGGRLCNVEGAYLFFLHSLMGNLFCFFCRGHGPPKPLCGSVPADRVTDDSGAMISNVILRMNRYRP